MTLWALAWVASSCLYSLFLTTGTYERLVWAQVNLVRSEIEKSQLRTCVQPFSVLAAVHETT